MASNNAPNRPFTLVTVNTSPERATRLIGRMVEALKDRYEIIHAANCSQIDQVEATVAKVQPDILFCASMWTAEEAVRIQAIAKETQPTVITYALPHGLQVARGPDAVVDHLIENVPTLLETVS